jgi:outer membrane protein assembly factor BamB
MAKANLAVLLFLLLLFSSFLAIPQELTAQSASDDWPMFQHDSAHTGYSNQVFTSNLTVAWTYRPNSTYNGLAYRTPIVADGYLYITDANYIYCIDASNGNLKWIQNLTITEKFSPWGPSTAFYKGIVYTGNAAYNASNGQPLFNFSVSGNTSPTVANDIIYIGSNKGGVVAINASNGGALWSKPGYNLTYSPAVANGIVYCSFANFFTERSDSYALNASSGTEIWHVTGVAGPYTHTVVGDGNVYIDGYGGFFYCLNATNGKTIWSYPAYVNPFSSSALAEGYLYAGFYALNSSTGKMIWNMTQLSGSSPAIVNGAVYINYFNFSVQGMTPYKESLIALNATTGNETWSYLFPGEYQSYGLSPPIIANGVVYVSAEDALYAFTSKNNAAPLLDNVFVQTLIVLIVSVIVLIAFFLVRKRRNKKFRLT